MEASTVLYVHKFPFPYGPVTLKKKRVSENFTDFPSMRSELWKLSTTWEVVAS